MFLFKSEYTSFLAIEDRDSDVNDVSTTPVIEELLSVDHDSSSIDILPYMTFLEDNQKILFESKKKIEDEFIQVLNDITKESDYLNNTEIAKLKEIFMGNHLNEKNTILVRYR